MPAVADYVGYLNTDLIGRMPYLPVNHFSENALIAIPQIGGAEIRLGNTSAGELRYWNWNWQPMHNKSMGSHGAVAVTLSGNITSELLGCAPEVVTRCWRATVCTRKESYGKWQEETYFGVF